MTKRRLWRVDFTDKIGNQAPSLFIETIEVLKYKAENEAINLAKRRSRLGDFPEIWTITAYSTNKKLVNNKWILNKHL